MNQPIVIFDGVCTLCNASVDFLIRHDRTGLLLFGSFQDERPRELLRSHGITQEPTTVYLIEGDTVYTESDAIIRLARYTNAPWRWFVSTRIIPRPLRDSLYRLIARNRYQWIGKRDTCRVPTAEEQSRFI